MQTVAGAVVVARVDKTSPPSLAAAGKKSNQLRKCHLGDAFYHFKSTMIFISSAMVSLAALEKKSNQQNKS